MIGIDLVKIKRIEKFIERFGNKGLQRFLHEDEIALIKNPKTAAGFWALKEATAKALQTGISKECGFHDITITKSAKNAPQVNLSDHLIKMYNITNTSASITHDGDYAIAVMTIEVEKG
jgi:holo-[acyl-carrier protein] synthase